MLFWLYAVHISMVMKVIIQENIEFHKEKEK